METLLTSVLEIRRSKRLKGSPVLQGDFTLSLQALFLALLADGQTRLENVPTSEDVKDLLQRLGTLGFTHENLDGHLLLQGQIEKQTETTEPVALKHELEMLIFAAWAAALGSAQIWQWNALTIAQDIFAVISKLFHIEEVQLDHAPPDLSDLELANLRAFRVKGLKVNPADPCKVSVYKLEEYPIKIALLFYHIAAGKNINLLLSKSGPDILEHLIQLFDGDLQIQKGAVEEGDELARRIARQMKAQGKQEVMETLKLKGTQKLQPTFIRIPNDVSEASAFALAATLIKGSDIFLENVLLNPTRALFFQALRRMGADIEILQRREKFGETFANVRVRTAELIGKRFSTENLLGMREEIFLLMIAAAYAEGESVIRDIAYLHAFPEDLLKHMANTLKNIGVEVGEFEDGLVIRGRAETDGTTTNALGQTPVALALVVLALKSHGQSVIENAECLEHRYPGLLEQFQQLGNNP